MSYSINGLGGIVRDSDGLNIPIDNDNHDYKDYLAWTSEGNTATTHQPDPQDLQRSLTQAVQAIMDDKARSYRYDDLTTAVTYADEPSVEKFQTEGRAFRQWRSDVWAACYAYLAEVEKGNKPFPSVDDLPGLIPPCPLDEPNH